MDAGQIRQMLLIALITLLSSCLASISVQCGIVEDKFSCPHGWTRYGSKKCLKYINELQDYERAQTTCRSKNQGTLVSIHSHEEQNFVYSYIHSIAASSTPVWLGAKQIDFESILWLDKTENTYTNWAPSEPSHPDEICIAINPRNGMWHDVMCTEANVPACERAPTTQWPFFVAFCSEGWFQFNDEKCVRIISSQALNFYESQELCRSKYNSKLLSIKSDKESEFLHNLIKFRDVKLPVWLGAVQNDFSSFNWIDKSDVTFTNWGEGEPNDPDHACLSMTASGGKWADNDCKEQKLILCQKAVPEDSSCETGWLQFRQDKCYRFVHIRLAFDDAESLCNNLYGGHLPSIHSQEEQFMLSQFLASVNVKNGSEIWLGGRQMDFHNFNWGDGSLFNYSYWEHGEPNFPAEKCIEMSWRNGRWNDINCRLKRAVLCEKQVTTRLHIKPNLYQPTTCLDLTNCTSSGSGGSGGSSGGPLDLGQNEQPDPPLAPASALNITSIIPAIELASNSTSGGGGGGGSMPGLTNRTTTEDSLMPEDNKPIKVISSIMHKDNQPVNNEPLVAAVAAAASGQPVLSSNTSTIISEMNANNNNSSTSFIHYNLPPPGRTLGDTQPSMVLDTQTETFSSSVGSQTKKDHSVVTNSNEQASTNELAGVRAPVQVAQQSFESPANLSLMDKIRLESSSVKQQSNVGNNSMGTILQPTNATSNNHNQVSNLTLSNHQQQQVSSVTLSSGDTNGAKLTPIAAAAAAVLPEKV